jgi:hypothetical protein
VYTARWPSASDVRWYCAAPRDVTRHSLPTILVTHLCGTTFRVRNQLATAAHLSWDVPEAAESGHAVLPPRGHTPYSETLLTPVNRGTLRLYRDGRMFAIAGNPGGRPCAESDTAPAHPAPLRLFYPEDIGRTVAPPANSSLRYYRTLLQVVFFDTTGGDQVRAAIGRWRAAIVAGGPYPNP